MLHVAFVLRGNRMLWMTLRGDISCDYLPDLDLDLGLYGHTIKTGTE